MLEAGVKAPDFKLQDKDGKEVCLSDFAGKKVVLYFYPKDNTPGCTKQACAFAGAYEQFKAIDAVVIGISKDSVASHQRFAEKFELPFILLSDTIDMRNLSVYFLIYKFIISFAISKITSSACGITPIMSKKP